MSDSLSSRVNLQRDADLSTNYKAKYSIENFIPMVEIQDEYGNVEIIPDYLSWNLTSLVASITNWTPVTYDGSVPLVTLVYRKYNTTTLIWLVLIYNGLNNALEIPKGITLKMPNQDQIDRYLQDVSSKVGKVVRV